MQQDVDDWVRRSRQVFDQPRPSKFTTCDCLECRDHEILLSANDVDTIRQEVFGGSGLTALRFATVQGQLYYMPALVRLCLQTIGRGIFLEEFLRFLDPTSSRQKPLLDHCSLEQRKFVSELLSCLIETRSGEIDRDGQSDEMLACFEKWALD